MSTTDFQPSLPIPQAHSQPYNLELLSYDGMVSVKQ